MKKSFARLAAALLAAALLAGCGASSSNQGGMAESAAATYDMSSEAALTQEAGGAESALLPEGADATTETAQKIIYRADMEMESTDFDSARDTLMAAVEANGAWMEYSHLSGSAEDHDRYANYTVRVPAENYSAFLSQAGAAGSVLSLNESAENVTMDYIDLEARITSLENQRDRLNDLAAKAETTADLLEIENQLSDVQYQLESYTQQQRALDGQITYSTVDIVLREVATLTPTGTTFVQRLGDAFQGGWNAFLLTVQGLILALVYLWPLLLLVAIIVILVCVATRRHRAKHPRPVRPPMAPPPPPNQPPAFPGASPSVPGDNESKPNS